MMLRNIALSSAVELALKCLAAAMIEAVLLLLPMERVNLMGASEWSVRSFPEKAKALQGFADYSFSALFFDFENIDNKGWGAGEIVGLDLFECLTWFLLFGIVFAVIWAVGAWLSPPKNPIQLRRRRKLWSIVFVLHLLGLVVALAVLSLNHNDRALLPQSTILAFGGSTLRVAFCAGVLGFSTWILSLFLAGFVGTVFGRGSAVLATVPFFWIGHSIKGPPTRPVAKAAEAPA